MTFSERAKSLLDVISGLAVIVAAGAIVWALVFRQAVPAAQDPIPVPRVEDIRAHLNSTDVTNVLGRGPIAIVEFSDFECPFCRRHSTETLPTLKADLVESGEVRYIVVNYPLEKTHPFAFAASEAAECASRQDRFWEMHELLFTDAGDFSTVGMTQRARRLQLDPAEFAKCLDTHETGDKIRSDQALGRRLGVTGTPAFFIGRVRTDGGVDLVKRIRAGATVEIFTKEVRAMATTSPRG